jgi:stage II sporulation protein AB (anti-sigma F factor)
MIELSLQGSNEAILEAARTVGDLSKELRLEKGRQEEVETAVAEALWNAFVHGNDGRVEEAIHLTAHIEDASLLVEVRDAGSGLAEIPELPNLDRKIAGEERSGGWGLFLMCSFASLVHFFRNPQGGHTVRLKFLDRSPKSIVKPRILRESDA